MSDILAELDEQMRAERMQKIWETHGSTIITAIAALILVVAGVSAYKAWNHKQDMKSTHAMFILTDDSTFPNNIDANTNLDHIRDGLRSAVLLKAANAYVTQEQPDQAINLYQRIIDDKHAEQSIHDLAILSKVKLMESQENADINALINDLNKIQKESAYYPVSTIEKAVLQAKMAEYVKAIATLEIVKDMPQLPETVYLKAQSLSHVYTIKKDSANKE